MCGEFAEAGNASCGDESEGPWSESREAVAELKGSEDVVGGASEVRASDDGLGDGCSGKGNA